MSPSPHCAVVVNPGIQAQQSSAVLPQRSRDEHLPLRPVLMLTREIDLTDVDYRLAPHQLTPLISARVEAAARILESTSVNAILFSTRVDRWESLLEVCQEQSVPMVLMGSQAEITGSRHSPRVDIHVPTPVAIDSLCAALVLAAAMSRDTSTLQLGAVTIDLIARRALLSGEDMLLPPKTLDLLIALAGREDCFISTEDLLHMLWLGAPGMTTQDVHWHVWRLRQLLEAQPGCALSVVNRRGYGYRLERH